MYTDGTDQRWKGQGSDGGDGPSSLEEKRVHPVQSGCLSEKERRQSQHTDAQHGGNVVEMWCVVVLCRWLHFLDEIRSWDPYPSQDGRKKNWRLEGGESVQ